MSTQKDILRYRQDDFMWWAFGEDDGTPLPERWNKLHGELFKVTEDDDQEEMLPKMVDAYSKSKGIN